MKKLLILCTFFGASMSFAQTDLYVSNNAATYVYVDGTGFAASGTNVPLYVTNSVNLAGSNSFIYLRNDAQLLQGNLSTGNSGVGRLSVNQTSTVNTYTYNYWSSPVGFVSNADNTSPLNNSVNNYFRANAGIYYETTAPITSSIAGYTSGYDGSASPLVISEYWLYTYDPGIMYAEWDQIFSIGNVLPGYGFTMKGNASSNQKYDFRGKPNNGLITADLLPGEQTLVGNPYPSALDALAFIHDPQNSIGITGDLYYWEQAPGATSHVLRNYIGGYATYTISALGVESFVNAVYQTYNNDGTVNNPSAGGGTKVARRYIPIGQGFMVEGKAAATTVFFKNSHRVYYKQSGVDSYFFRNSSDDSSDNDELLYETQYNDYGYNIVPEDFKRFRINVDFENVGIYTRQLLMNFHHTATDGFDYGLEAKSPEGPNSDANWVLNNEPYNIQAFTFEENLRIPLVVKLDKQQPVRFRIFDIQNFDDSQPIYLHDIEADLYVNLRAQNYDINLPTGNYTNRFEITFIENNALSTPDVTIADFKIFQDNPQGQLTILNPKGIDIKAVQMFDTAGKQIFNKRNLTLESEYHFTTKKLSDGVYVATITLNDSKTMSKKVIIKN